LIPNIIVYIHKDIINVVITFVTSTTENNMLRHMLL